MNFAQRVRRRDLHGDLLGFVNETGTNKVF